MSEIQKDFEFVKFSYWGATQKQPPEVLYEKGVVKTFAKLTRKQLPQGLKRY